MNPNPSSDSGAQTSVLAALPLLTGGGYTIAYAREFGYAHAYGIPTSLIGLSYSTILLSIVALAPVLLPIMNVYLSSDTVEWLGRRWPHIAERLLIAIGLAAYGLAFAVVYVRHLDHVLELTLPILFMALLFAVARPKKPPRPPQTRVGVAIDRAVLRGQTVLLVIVVAVAILSYALGDASALDQRTFLSDASGGQLLLNQYGEHWVFAHYDKKQETITSFEILTSSDVAHMRLVPIDLPTPLHGLDSH